MGTQIKQPLKVYLSDISPHSQAILEFFIGSTGGKSFTLVSTPADAEMYITDFDFPGSKEHWETEHAISAKPCIVLSMEDPNNQHVEWVAKPITAQALITAAKTISSRMDENIAGHVSVSTPSTSAARPNTIKVPETTKAVPAEPTIATTNTSLDQPQVAPPPLPKIASGQSPFRKTIHTKTPAIHTRAPAFHEDDGDTSVVVKAEATQVLTTSEAQTTPALDVSNSNQEANPKAQPKIQSKTKPVATDDIPSEQTEAELEASKQTRIAQAENAQNRWALLCGIEENVTHATLKQNESFTYNSENYFQGTLIAGLRLAKQTKQVVQIKYEPYQFYICYDEGLVFSPIDPGSDDYAKLCYTKVKPGQVNLHILTSPESTDIREKISSDANFTYDLESFIWTSCLLTSRGRVPSSLDCEDLYLLKYWPNYTRIENFPFAMKIAARWQKRPYKVADIAKEMDIPIRYITAFYNGAIGLSLFETDMSIVQQKSHIKPKKKNGLIARLFGRLTKSESPS